MNTRTLNIYTYSLAILSKITCNKNVTRQKLTKLNCKLNSISMICKAITLSRVHSLQIIMTPNITKGGVKRNESCLTIKYRAMWKVPFGTMSHRIGNERVVVECPMLLFFLLKLFGRAIWLYVQYRLVWKEPIVRPMVIIPLGCLTKCATLFHMSSPRSIASMTCRKKEKFTGKKY